MGSIAERADIARSTIYLYFADKGPLIQRTFEDRIGTVFDDFRINQMSPDTRFDAAFRMVLEIVYARMTSADALVLLWVLIAEGTRFPELAKFYHETILRCGEMILESLIDTGIEQGELRREIATFDRKLINGPAVAVGIWPLTFQALEPLDMPRFIDYHVDILTNGLLLRQG